MSKLKIAFIITTNACVGDKPAQWIRDIGADRDDMDIEIVGLVGGTETCEQLRIVAAELQLEPIRMAVYIREDESHQRD
jgi:hypothetical protein